MSNRIRINGVLFEAVEKETKIDRLEDIFDERDLGTVRMLDDGYVELETQSEAGEDVVLEADCDGPDDLNGLIYRLEYMMNPNENSIEDYFEINFNGGKNGLGVYQLVRGYEQSQEIYKKWLKAVNDANKRK